MAYDFRWMGEDFSGGDIWYSLGWDVSIVQYKEVFCGWRGGLGEIPGMDGMVIGRSMDEVLDGMLRGGHRLEWERERRRFSNGGHIGGGEG